MKNKHIVLIFLGTVIIGLLSRRFPWRMPSMFQTDLIELDTTAVTQISISQPGLSELLFERTDRGWTVSQNERSLPLAQDAMTPMLSALTSIQSLNIVQTDQPDSLGLEGQRGLQVTVYQAKERLENFTIGRQVLEAKLPATYIRLDGHGGIYLVKEHLRDVFFHRMEAYRKNTLAEFDPATVRSVTVNWPRDTLSMFLQKEDSLECWIAKELGRCVPDDSLQNWLQVIAQLNNLPFADDFDDSRLRQTLHAEITVETIQKEIITLQVHNPAAPEWPKEKSPVSWVLYTSQNPRNYFSLTDTTLARRILHW